MPSTVTESAAPREDGSKAPAASAGGRLLWADAAKGLTIFLVVLNHLVRRHYPEVAAGPDALLADGWVLAMQALDPIRMPLFFLLSGFFAASAVRRSWSAVWSRRVLRPYWLFAVWLLIHAAFFTFEPDLPTTRIDSPAELAAQLLLPSSSLWFLYALALFFAVAWALRALPPKAAAACLSLGVLATAAAMPEAAEPLVRNLPFFLLGAFAPQMVRTVADAATPARVLGLALAYAGLLAASAAGVLAAPPAGVALSACGVALALTALALATRGLPQLARGAAGVGRMTLPVYVLHLPVLAVWSGAVHGLALPAPLLAVYPLLAAAIVVVACRATHRLMVASSLGWLFDLPQQRAGQVAFSSRGPVPRARFAA